MNKRRRGAWGSVLALLVVLGVAGAAAGAFLRPGVAVRDGKSRYPAVTSDAAGRVYLVWVDARSGGAKLYFNRSADGGTTWLAEDVLITPTLPEDSRITAPQIAVDGRGGVWVAWELIGRGDKTIWVAASRDVGASWDPPSRLPDLGHAFSPQLVADDRGRVAIVWREELRQGAGDGLYLATSPDRGSHWTARRLDIGTPAGVLSGQRLGLDGAGRLYALWWERRGGGRWARPVFTMSPDFGTSWLERPIELSAGDKSAQNPQLAVAPTGHVYAVWAGLTETGTAGIYLAVSTDHGRTWRPERRLDRAEPGTLALLPQVAADPDGHVSVVWKADRKAGAGLYGSFSADAGQTWSAERLLQPAPDGHELTFPLLVSSGQGSLALAWVLESAAPEKAPRLAEGTTGIGVAVSVDRGARWTTLPLLKPWPRRILSRKAGTLVPPGSFFLVWEELTPPEEPAARMNPAAWRRISGDLDARRFPLTGSTP